MKFSYGTAGFRADALILESTVFRAGILAALRSIKTRSMIGMMITASHNKISDNGVKIADPSGGMLTQQWEPFADALANAPDSDRLLQVLSFSLCNPSLNAGRVCPNTRRTCYSLRSDGIIHCNWNVKSLNICCSN